MPINEYGDLPLEKSKDSVLVEIRSVQNDLTGTGLFGTVPEEMKNALADEGESEDAYTLTSVGSLSRSSDGVYELRYSETGNESKLVTDTSVSFHEKKPGRVTVTRSGEVSSSFVIEEKVRQTSVYTTPFGAFEMCVLAKKVRNTVDADGGKIELDYIVELKGLSAQHTKMTFKIKTQNN